MKIIGYGEDALTYEMLNNRMPVFLREMGDKSKLNDVVFLYRPSFGRGEKGFGEFDAIVGTNEFIYLIESKWTYSTEVKRGNIKEITLRAPQTRRHVIFQKLNDLRNKYKNQFEDYLDKNVSSSIGTWAIPKSDRNLSSNIKMIFRQLYPNNGARKVCNVVLLFFPQNSDIPALPVYSVVSGGSEAVFKTLVWRYNFMVDKSDKKQNRFFTFE